MFQNLRRLAGYSGLYGLGLLGSRLAAMVLTPMFLHALNRGEYGMMELLNNITSILSSVLLLGAAGVLPKVYARDCQTDEERKRMLTSILTFSVVMAGLLLLFSVFFASSVSRMLFNDGSYAGLVRMAAAASALLVTQNMVMIFLRVKQWPIKFLIVSLTQVVLMLLLNIYLVGMRHTGVYGVQVASLVSCSVSFCVGLFLVRKYLSPALSPRLVKHVLRLSIPLIPAAVAPWVLNVSDRYFLNHYVGLSETGLYSAGYKLGMIGMNLLINAFQLSWGPFFFSHEDEGAPELCASVLKYYALLLGGFALLFSVFAPDILRVISKREYWSAGWIVPYVALAYLLYGIQFYTVPLFLRADRGKWLSILMGGAAVVNLGLNYALIPRFGITGAVASTLACFAALCIAAMVVVARMYPVRYDYGGIAKVFGVCVGLYFATRLLPAGTALAALKLLVVPAFVVLLWGLQFFDAMLVQSLMVRLGLRRRYA